MKNLKKKKKGRARRRRKGEDDIRGITGTMDWGGKT